MSGNSVFRHQHSGILSLAAIEAPRVITSEWIDEQLADTYVRNGLHPGLLAGLAGIVERRWWDDDVTFADAAAMAGRAAIEKAGIDASQIGILISTSVCKENLEPSVACSVHHMLGLPSSCLNFDIGNACLGFGNAIYVAATMLDAGAIDYALIVDGEGSRYTQETTLARLRDPNSPPRTSLPSSPRSHSVLARQRWFLRALIVTPKPTAWSVAWRVRLRSTTNCALAASIA